jgi:hypothetical protein
MTHPGGGGGTGPGGGGGTGPGRHNLPTLGMVIRDAERYITHALTTLNRDVDPASEPTELAWPAISDEIRVHDLHLGDAKAMLELILNRLARVATLPSMPSAGSAVTYPADDTSPRMVRPYVLAERHDPDRPGAPGLPPRPIDYPRPSGQVAQHSRGIR